MADNTNEPESPLSGKALKETIDDVSNLGETTHLAPMGDPKLSSSQLMNTAEINGVQADTPMGNDNKSEHLVTEGKVLNQLKG